MRAAIVSQSIFSFVNGATTGEQIGGIQAVRELISCPSASAEAKVLKFAQALSTALKETNDFALVELIADAFGHMARTSPVSDVDYLEGELNRALDWLKGRHAPYRYRAVASSRRGGVGFGLISSCLCILRSGAVVVTAGSYCCLCCTCCLRMLHCICEHAVVLISPSCAVFPAQAVCGVRRAEAAGAQCAHYILRARE